MAFINVYQSTRRDTRIQIGAEELLFPMAFGNDWTRLRIGVRFYVLSGYPVSLLTCRLFFGVCTGEGYSSRNCGGWVGMTQPDGVTYNVVANNPGYYSAGSISWAWKTGTSTNFINTATINTYALATRYPCHGGWLANITKPSYLQTGNTWLVTPYSPAVASASTDLTFTNFIEAARNFSAPGGYWYSPPSNAAFSYPGNTNLNTLSIYWNRSVPVIEISDVVVYRIS